MKCDTNAPISVSPRAGGGGGDTWRVTGVENYDTSSGNFFLDGCVALPQGGGGGGVLYFFRIRRLGPSIYHSPPKNIRNLKHPKKYLKF